MNVSGIFYTIQGEGIYIGVPSVFVRLSGCNLRCSWCDTPYTSWNPENNQKIIREVVQTALFAGGEKCDHIVITGGEPMIGPGQLRVLVDEFICAGKQVTIETNGTIYNHSIKPTLWSISPKLSNSAPGPEHEKERDIHQRNNTLDEIPRFLQSGVMCQFKFVVQRREDLIEIQDVIRQCVIPANRVILMPEGITPEAMVERGRLCAELAKETGYRVTPRYHVSLWGNERDK